MFLATLQCKMVKQEMKQSSSDSYTIFFNFRLYFQTYTIANVFKTFPVLQNGGLIILQIISCWKSIALIGTVWKILFLYEAPYNFRLQEPVCDRYLEIWFDYQQ